MIGRALKCIRLFHEMTQKGLAKELNLSDTLISEIENGNKAVTMTTLQKYADYFGVPVAELMLFAESLENDPPRVAKIRKFVAKKILDVMDYWVIMGE